jgi:uncharacterized protein YfaS (alpha-2-macroglobulin family)
MKRTKKTLLSLGLVFIGLLLFAFLAVALEKPVGSISGRLALEQPGFDLYSYNLRNNKVYALAIGPRDGTTVERGVWLNKNGSFQINQLPIGEYALQIKVPGFSTFYESGIFVDEGKITRLAKDVTLELQNPTVNIASNTRVFTGLECPHFWINASGADRAVVKIYRQDAWTLMHNKTTSKSPMHFGPSLELYRNDNEKTKLFAKEIPEIVWTRNLTRDVEDWSREHFKCDKPLAKGDYIVVVEVKGFKEQTNSNAMWFSVSDLGLIIKQDFTKTVVRAINLNTLRPESNVNIDLFNKEDMTNIGSAKTNNTGFVDIANPKRVAVVLAYGKKGEDAAYSSMPYYYSDYGPERYKTYFYTDRPIYRLGQTVCYKGMLRSNALKNPGENVNVEATLEDPSNTKVWHGNLKTNSFGTFNGIFSIPLTGKTGAYQVTFSLPDGTKDYEHFEVEQYRKPEYQVEVSSLESQVIAGNKARAKIRATYYFGAPVTNAKVKYSIYKSVNWTLRNKLLEKPAYYSFFDDWFDEYSESDYGYGGEFVTEGYAQTDATGEAIVEFVTNPNKFDANDINTYSFKDQTYKIEAEVTDLSRLSVIGNGNVAVASGDYAVIVNPENYVYKVGDIIKATYKTVNYSGDPLANTPTKLSLIRCKTDRNNSLSSNRGIEVLEEIDSISGADGAGTVTFKTLPQYQTDIYYIVARSQDKGNHIISDSSSVWIASKNYPYIASENEAGKEPLSIRLDKSVYKPGDVAKVMITAPVTGKEGVEAIISIEGDKLYSYKTISMDATAQLVEIPISSQYAPNVHIAATFIGAKHQFYSQSKVLKVSPEEHFLNLTVTSDKTQYKPGDTAKYVIKATDANGKPAKQTEISLALVDESIFAIRPDTAYNIKKFFYSQKPNCVLTACSFPEEYSGGPNKIEPRMRHDFKDTAAWLPNLVTDDNGIASASIKLPDNLTTWRATVRAIDMNTNVGDGIQKVVSTQDIIVRLALPRFFTQGDEGIITAIVHNYSKTPQDIVLNLNASKNIKINKDSKQQLKIAPDKAARFSWPAEIIGSGEAKISIKAQGQIAGDAMESKISIRPLGIPILAVKGGSIEGTNDQTAISLPMPNNIDPSSIKYNIRLSSSSLSSIYSNFSSLIDYPYGCTEQTMSKLIPATVAIRLHKSLAAPLSDKDLSKFNIVYKQSLEKLYQYQHSDGGWGWWENDSSSAYLTALVMEGFYQLKATGYSVDSKRLTNGKAWLSTNVKQLGKQLRDPLLLKENRFESIIDLAKMHYVLSLYNTKISQDVKPWILQHKNEMPPEALSYFCLALQQQNDMKSAEDVYKRLLDLSNNTTSNFGNVISWETSPELLKKLGINSPYSYRFTAVETTALALEAAIALEANNSDKINQIKNWILTQRGKDGWGNTKTTARVILALTKDEITNKTKGANNFIVSINTENKSLKQFSFNESSRFKPEQQFVIEGKKIDKEIILSKQGNGKLYYTAELSYFLPISSGMQTSNLSIPNNLKITREFFRIVASPADSNGNIHLKAEKVSSLQPTFHAGETILMKVNVDTPTRIPYTMLESYLPSGAEVVSNRAKEDAALADAYKYDSEFSSWWWTHEDILDDRIVYFASDFPKGKASLFALMRLELPGKFQVNPMVLEGMYTNAMRSYSPHNIIEVVE